jgi:2-polyprenyl-3-methyl-5-hydroxy-6-metoxy-1,4-benzoquinol methylase
MESHIRDGLLSGYLRRARLKRAARYVVGRSLLDLGCDRGYLIPYLPPAIVYHGVDANPDMLACARHQYSQHTFQQLMLSTETLGLLPPQTFDTIMMVAIIEHLGDPIEVLRRLGNKLAPSGRIVITSPHCRSHRLLVAMARAGLARNDKHEHEHYIDDSMIRELLCGTSLELFASKRFQFGLNQLWVLQKREF